MNGPFVTGLVLAAWFPIAFALTRYAEVRSRASSGTANVLPAAACAVVVGAVACLRPAASGIACGATCIALVVAAFADARTGYLFDLVTFPAATIAAGVAIASGQTSSAAAGVFIVVAVFGSIVLWSRGRFMGLGDVKAMYAVGAAFGPAEAVFAIFAACISGIATAVVARRFERGREIRFGPHLAAGSAIALAIGDPVVHGVLGL